MELRQYQTDAVESVYDYLYNNEEGNPCVVIPTGGGKTPVIATICRDTVEKWGGRVLVVAHVKELLEQSIDKIKTIWPEAPVGVHSAGLGSRDTKAQILVAGVQSAYSRAAQLGFFNLVIIDENHLVPPNGEGMYRQLLKTLKDINPELRIIGLTATPFRMTSGSVCGPDKIMTDICYTKPIPELIDEGFLCKLVSKTTKNPINLDGVHIRAGEYMADELEDAMDKADVVAKACEELTTFARDRKSVLVFCSGLTHMRHVATKLDELTGTSLFDRTRIECVSGDTPAITRAQILADFKAGAIKYLLNVNVLTTGFDAPNVDCVVLLRATKSPGLYYQMCGRGFRICEGKDDCLILDFGGNILEHGCLDEIQAIAEKQGRDGEAEPRKAKECPMCQRCVPPHKMACPGCGYQWPPPALVVNHDAKATDEGILSGQTEAKRFEVKSISYGRHTKRLATEGDVPTLKVTYQTGFGTWVNEWVCIEHNPENLDLGDPRRRGWARVRAKAKFWWDRRCSLPMPATVDEAVEIGRNGGLAKCTEIKVKKKPDGFEEVVDWILEPRPDVSVINCLPPVEIATDNYIEKPSGWYDGEWKPIHNPKNEQGE